MLQRGMLMRVRVPARLRDLLMLVLVMPILMGVQMFMLLSCMPVSMTVLLVIQNGNRCNKKNRRNPMLPGEGLTQQQD